MSLTVVALGGPAASGKSSIIKSVVEKTAEVRYNGNNFKWGEVVGEFWTDDELVLYGRYNTDRDFEGTDMLSLSANNHAKQFTQMLVGIDEFNYVLFEGDRLYNDSFFEVCREHPDINLRAFVLDVSDEELDRRHEERDDDLDRSWVEGLRSQYERYLNESWTVSLDNETEADQQENIRIISDAVGLEDHDTDVETDQTQSLTSFK